MFGHQRRRNRGQRGAVVVEFALVAFAFYLLMAATVELGRAIFLAQASQTVARTVARELALTPLPATLDFDQALASPAVRARVYDPTWLVVDLDDVDNPATSAVETTVDELFATLPPVNRALRPMMIIDRPVIAGAPRRLLRVPGALLTSADPGAEFTVQVPLVRARDSATGAETDVEWARVIEEVRPDRADPATGSFSLLAPGGGLVAVRVNVPFQSGMLTGHRTSAGGIYDPNALQTLTADDTGAVGAGPPLAGADFIGSLDNLDVDLPGPRAYAGRAGLGGHFGLGRNVRPFRKVLAGQAVFRREVVLP